MPFTHVKAFLNKLAQDLSSPHSTDYITSSDVPTNKRAMDVNMRDESVVHFCRSLRINDTAASRDMNVVGTLSIPVDFIIGPTATGEVWKLTHMAMAIQDGGTLDPTDYGAISTLANGTDIIQDIGGTEHLLVNLNQNTDIINQFGAAFNFVGSQGGFLNDTKIYFGMHVFHPQPTFSFNDGDRLISRVQDDLSSIALHYTTALFQRTI